MSNKTLKKKLNLERLNYINKVNDDLGPGNMCDKTYEKIMKNNCNRNMSLIQSNILQLKEL